MTVAATGQPNADVRRADGCTTIEVPAGHLPMVSHAAEVADLIETAAKAVPVAA